MLRKLTVEEVKYKSSFKNIGMSIDNKYYLPEYDEVYTQIKTALEINKEGYNVYIIDDFSKDKLENIISFVESNFKEEPPKDICYVVYEDAKNPKAFFLGNGEGNVFKKYVEDIQRIYLENTFDFYNTSEHKEKEKLVEIVEKNRSELVSKMVKIAEENGFDIKFNQGGFTFVPIKDDGKPMSEKEYDVLESVEKDDILNKVSVLKKKAQDILDEMKDKEEEGIENIRELLVQYYTECSKDIKKSYKKEFKGEEQVLSFLDNICAEIEKQLMDNYTMSYEEDEEGISEIIYKYTVNVIVDNTNYKKPRCIYEEDPSLSNLLGSIEYENKNGTYVTDVSLIKAGSMLKANGGCLIIRINNLLANPSSYYYLKKSLMNEKVDMDYNRGYLELLSLSGLHPEPIKIKEKVILIGDYESYDVLYSYDEDFKKIFKIKAEFNPLVKINDNNHSALLRIINKITKENNLMPLEKGAVLEVEKYLSRVAESKRKMVFNDWQIDKLLMLANNKVVNEGRNKIKAKDIVSIAYKEESIEKEFQEYFEEKKIFINVCDRVVGQINGLTVLDTGYVSFGKPVKITCCCYKGDGNIIDVQKDSDLSGKIHSKAINILRGYMNTLMGGYRKLPVDFHLTFEQIYGKIDGDSASVAEVVVMLSSLSKIGIKNNIAVTGSLNQFGEVQPIGGVNEKIEGFFKICKKLDTVKGKGVLIPATNVDNIVLSPEVEQAIAKGSFSIYTMDTIEDAVNLLMGEEGIDFKGVLKAMENEMVKYISVTNTTPKKKKSSSRAKVKEEVIEKNEIE